MQHIARTHFRMFVSAVACMVALPAAAADLVYEGRLDEYGVPANGRFDLQVVAYDGQAKGSALAAPTTFENVLVEAGRFRVELQLPSDVSADLWVELAVRGDDENGAFEPIPGRNKAAPAKAIGACWSSTGDSGTDSSHFLGTTDARALRFKVDDRPVSRFEPSALQFLSGPATATIISGCGANSSSGLARGVTVAGGGAYPSSDPDYADAGPNSAYDNYSTVSGGLNNRAGVLNADSDDGAFAVVAGGYMNRASALSSTIGGGSTNTASAVGATVSGGEGNTASANDATVGGGDANDASGPGSTIAGGRMNDAPGVNSTVAGGYDNLANDTSAVGGGTANDANGGGATVAGGARNTASGNYSSIGGGIENCAGGMYSWAGGRSAKVRPGSFSGAAGNGCDFVAEAAADAGDQGTFVWADSQSGDFVSTNENQFLVRAENGMAINSTTAGSGNSLRVNGRVRIDLLGAAGSTHLCRNASFQVASCSSSARYKEHIADLDLGLAAVELLRPVAYDWKETHEADVGFVAEEVAALDPRLVTRNERGEVEGVKYERLSALLAGAVQELAKRERVQAAELTELRRRLEALEARSGR